MKDILFSVDALKKGNWTRYINDGFPNVISYDLLNTAGQKCRKLFFVANKIEKGESLLYDYSCFYHYLKWENPYFLEKKEEIREFFKEFTKNTMLLNQLAKNLNGSTTGKKLLEFRALEARLFFPFQTPIALIDLAFSQTIKVSEWLEFFKQENKKTSKNSSFKTLFESNDKNYVGINNLLEELTEFEDFSVDLAITEAGKNFVERIRKVILDNEEAVPANQLLNDLQELNKLIWQSVEKWNSQKIVTTEIHFQEIYKKLTEMPSFKGLELPF